MRPLEIIPVRLIRDEAAVARAARWLDAAEQQRAARFLFFEPSASFTVARAVLRQLLADRLNIPAPAVAFTYGQHGKPALAEPHSHLRFNVSHSGGMALYGFSWSGEIGVDVEQHRRIGEREDIARRFFHPDECARILALPAEARDQAFFDCWARKEAYIKATGMGLYLPLTGFQVPVASPPDLRQFQTWNEDPKRWTLHVPSRVIAGYSQAAVWEAGADTVLESDCLDSTSILQIE